MKKIKLTFILSILSITSFAQLSGNLRAGSSNHTDNLVELPTSSGFYFYMGIGYRFFNEEHITIEPKIIFDRTGFSNTSSLFDENFSLVPAEVTINFYSLGLEINSEIKLLNPTKKFNIYTAPFVSYRKLVKSKTELKSSIENSTSKKLLENDKLFDWGLEVGVIYNQFKFGLFYRDILNKSSRGNSSFVITNALGINLTYMLNLKKKTATKIEED